MNNQFTEQEQMAVSEENETSVNIINKKVLNKKNIIIGSIALGIVIVLALIIFIPSKFERVRRECVQIAGQVTGSGDYFMIDTCPDSYDNMSESIKNLLLSKAEDNALEAIKYANEAFGFNGAVYSQMLNTSALMGRQSEENDKYKVSWTYHPDDGLEVTYEKK